MLLLIDNYDSFASNVARYFRRLGTETKVVRNDAMTIADIEKLNPVAIVISPGPCSPNEAGISCEVVEQFQARVPILGICLGHQAIAQSLGGKIVKANEPFHGRQSTLTHFGHSLFQDVPKKFDACRYHSLVIERGSLPSDFDIIAEAADETIMAIANDEKKLFGLQFHPESILTPFGFQMLQNFLRLCPPSHKKAVPSGLELFQSESKSASKSAGKSTTKSESYVGERSK